MKYTLNLNISDDQRKDLIEFYREKSQKLRNEIKELEDLIVQLNSLTSAVHTNNSHEVEPPKNRLSATEYKESWGWALKVRYVLAKLGRCSTTREIIDELKKYEAFDKDPINSVSGTLSSKANKGIMFGKYKPYETELYFGLKEWFDQEGNVKAEHSAL